MVIPKFVTKIQFLE